MRLRIGADAQLEVEFAAQSGDEVRGVRESTGMRLVPGADAGHRITAQRDEVADTGIPVLARDLENLLARGRDAGEVSGGRSVVSDSIRRTVACVRSRVDPPAPYVTETKLGLSGARRSTARHSCASISSVFGGKNSNETPNRLALGRLRMEGLMRIPSGVEVNSPR
ncbi:MAG: hypothetical protein U5K74_08985 [Gemmatimonadaceae bacterium]|nr:hypothetical protein [Gemmatimonadaceae bacterium]